MPFDIEDVETESFRIRGQDYVLAKPSVGLIREMQKGLKELGNDGAIEVMSKLLVKCGLPEDVADSLQMSGFTKILNKLTGQDQEKKLTASDVNIFRLCRFYGWTVEYVLNLSLDHFFKALSAIVIIESSESLSALSIADFPHMKTENRKKVHKQLYKNSKSFEDESGVRMSTADLARMLRGK